ncbi:MAG: phospho-N-acetylmuramoyl-pentapeptide-transferase [Synergistaceae bacterium]
MYIFILVFSFLIEILMQNFWIMKMHSLKIEQITKEYGPSWHEKTKLGTPTMGGVVFIPVYLIAMVIASILNPEMFNPRGVLIYSYPILVAVIGFVDDWIKHAKNSSDGLTSKQKLFLQLIATVLWTICVYATGNRFFLEFSLPIYILLPIVTFISVGFQNAVNVTDGLDGLATKAMLISFLFALFFMKMNIFSTVSLFCGIGICIGFLWHNSNPATVFMGDVGAHFLAGLLLSICVASSNTLIIIPLGFLFGIEILSVSIQIFSIRCFHKKVFRMSPIHHHFEMLGWKENKIVSRFLIIHTIGIFMLIMLFDFLITMFNPCCL